jgi:hypothetical protein
MDPGAVAPAAQGPVDTRRVLTDEEWDFRIAEFDRAVFCCKKPDLVAPAAQWPEDTGQDWTDKEWDMEVAKFLHFITQ